MASQPPDGTARYHRRLDRSPEKPEFQKLPDQDKRLISNLRNVMEDAREKVHKLRDEVEERELEVTHESALRKATQAKLDQFVDMYGDPSVTQELQERLPEAARHEARKQKEREIAALEAGDEKPALLARQRLGLSDEKEDQPYSRRRAKSEETARRKPLEGDEDEDEDTVRSSRRQRCHSPAPPGHQQPQAVAPFLHNYYPSIYAFPTPMVYPALFEATNPMMSHHPLSHPPMSHPPSHSVSQPPSQPSQQPAPSANPSQPSSSLPQPAPTRIAIKNNDPVYYPSSSNTVPPHNINIPVYTITAPSHPQPSNPHPSNPHPSYPQPSNPHPSHPQPSNPHLSNPTQATEVPVNNGVAYYRPVYTDQPADGSAPAGTGPAWDKSLQREQARQISLLLVELNSSKELNTDMRERLSKAENAYELARVAEETKEAAVRAEVAGQAAELVEQVYRAQKVRDEAVMGRLRLANEERDAALLKLKAKEKQRNPPATLNNNTKAPVTLQDIVRNLDNIDASHLNEHRAAMIEAFKTKSARQQQMTTEEMHAILEERDSAVNKSRKLEGQLLRLQQQMRSEKTDKTNPSMLQAKIYAVEHERDAALGRIKKLEEELQTLRVYYSLHKSLSQEANLRDQFNNTLDNIEGELRQRDDTLNMAQKENNRLLAQLKSAVADKQRMADDLSKAQASQRESEREVEKLERLVTVLRMKVQNMGFDLDDQREGE